MLFDSKNNLILTIINNIGLKSFNFNTSLVLIKILII